MGFWPKTYPSSLVPLRRQAALGLPFGLENDLKQTYKTSMDYGFEGIFFLQAGADAAFLVGKFCTGFC